MKTEWYTPKENLPPLDKPVMLDLTFRFGGSMHAYGWLTESGWETSSYIKEYTVKRWSYFISGKREN
jgi:hypothetical protein